MNAHAMVGPYTANFNTAVMANDINKHNFANLKVDRHGDLYLMPGQALYMYGGRTSLLTAIKEIKPGLRIISYKWEGKVTLFRVSRKVAGGTKTKQLLMFANVSKIPATLQQYEIQVDDHGFFDVQTNLLPAIQNLSK